MLEVSIPGCQVGEAFVTFTIVVTKGESSWTVRRRYQDFVKLHAALRKAFPQGVAAGSGASGAGGASASASPSSGGGAGGGGAGGGAGVGADGGVLPELPPKKVRLGLSKFAPDFVEERRSKLESYLQRVVSLVDPERAEALDDFLVYAEHWLRDALELLGDVRELQVVVRMLRQAAETAAAVHQKRTGASGGGAVKRRGGGDSDDDDGGDEDGGGGGGGPPEKGASASASAAAAAADGPELLAQLREVVRMLREYAVMTRSQCEDAEERGEATAASSGALAARLRGRQDDIADARQMMEALRQARARECEKERTQLLLVSQQARTVAAELRRVTAETACLRAQGAVHASALAALRATLGEWERGLGLQPSAAAALAAAASAAADAAASSSSSSSSSSSGGGGGGGGGALSPLQQVASLCARAELFAHDADEQARAVRGPVEIGPGMGGGGSGLQTADAAAAAASLDASVADVARGSAVSGPSFAAALLLHNVAADSAGLLMTLHALAAGDVVQRPRVAAAASSSSSGVAANGSAGAARGLPGGPPGPANPATPAYAQAGAARAVVGGAAANGGLNPLLAYGGAGGQARAGGAGGGGGGGGDEGELSAARLAIRAAMAKNASSGASAAAASAGLASPGNPFGGGGGAGARGGAPAGVGSPLGTARAGGAAATTPGNPFGGAGAAGAGAAGAGASRAPAAAPAAAASASKGGNPFAF
jgi:hypothetical protein